MKERKKKNVATTEKDTLEIEKNIANTKYDEETKKLLTSKEEYEEMSKASNPYGDGHASERITDEIIKRYTLKRES